nr:hypothetical protein CFP56_34460 [Quercus suber]
MALTLDTIWNLRNQLAHDRVQEVNIEKIINTLEFRVMKNVVLKKLAEDEKHIIQVQWLCLPLGPIKLIVDAAVTEELTSLVAVAKNENGDILKVWTKSPSVV